MRDLFTPSRYKAYHGGRGGGKSHSYAQALILMAAQKPLRILCCRETQKSIRDSVKRLLTDKITAAGLDGFYDSIETEIRGANGSLFVFAGLRTDPNTIRSLEGIDIAWVEEAHSVSQASLNILIPTIRKDNSEIWFSWNPRDKKDPVDAMFRSGTPPPNAVVRQVNWDDNPWFPDVLQAELEWDRDRDPDKYAHVWGGGYVVHSESRVFKNWKIGVEDIPDGARPYYGADWGFAKDPAVLIRLWIIGPRQLYIDAEAYQVGCEIDKTPDLFDKIDDGDARRWPIKADSARPETISYMQRHGYPHIVPAIKGPGSVEDGVEFLKSYDITIHPDCKHTIDEFTYYSYKTDKLTDEVLPVLEDKHNHVVDACIAEGQLITCKNGDVPIEHVKVGDHVLTRSGYKEVLFSGITDINRSLVRVETSNGSVDCTPDHRIYTSKGFVRADALRYNDEIINVEHKECLKPLSGMVRNTGAILTASISRIGCILSAHLEGRDISCTGMSGNMRMVPFRMGTRYITATKIREIILRHISFASRQPNTRRSIHSMLTGLRGSGSILSASDRSPKHGIPAKRAPRSIARLVRWPIRTLCRYPSPATNAATCSLQDRRATGTGFARTPANLRTAATRALTMLKGAVYGVARLSPRTSIARPKLVRGRVLTVKELETKGNVYDLTVDGQPEFFAGGVLVHNCRYGLESVRMSLVGDQPEQDFLFEPSKVQVLTEWPRVYALDIDGGTASMIWGAHDVHSDTVYLYGEYVEDKARLETWAAGIRKRGRNIPGIFDMTARRRTEEQGERIVESLLDQSLDIYTSEADVESAASEINGRIATQQLKVASNLTNWLTQYRAYRRDAKGDIVEEGDGLMHATGLLLVSGLSISHVDERVADEAMAEWGDQSRNPVTGY